MASSTFHKAEVLGLTACAPANERCIDDEVKLLGGNLAQIERLKKTIGLHKRRVVLPGTTAVDLCVTAAEKLLAACQCEPGDVDAVIFVTQMPDYPQPGNASLLHARLGLGTDCAALDVNLGCSGYVYGLWLAHMMIESGGCERVLLLAGDTVSTLVHEQDRALAPLFGDGGSATLLGLRSPESAKSARPAHFSLHADGRGQDALKVPAGGARTPHSPEQATAEADEHGNTRAPINLHMDGSAVFTFSVTTVPAGIKALLEQSDTTVEAVDRFVLHQANRYILSNIAKRLKVDAAKVPMRTVEHFGNQSSASIPTALCFECGPELTDGPVQRILLSGFGVGLSWGSALLDLGGLKIADCIDYPAAKS